MNISFALHLQRFIAYTERTGLLVLCNKCSVNFILAQYVLYRVDEHSLLQWASSMTSLEKVI